MRTREGQHCRSDEVRQIKLSTKLIWFVILAAFLYLLWLALFVIYPQLTLMTNSYEVHDAACQGQGLGQAVISNGSPIGCTGEPTNYRGGIY